jgi:hypothetical protein
MKVDKIKGNNPLRKIQEIRTTLEIFGKSAPLNNCNRDKNLPVFV